MKRVLFLVNHDVVIYNFRKELVERLLRDGNEVVISSPYGERIDLLKNMGCRYVPVKLDRHGKNQAYLLLHRTDQDSEARYDFFLYNKAESVRSAGCRCL